MKNKRLLFLALVAFVVSIGRLPVFTQQPPPTAAPDGETLFLGGCVINCHDGSDNARAAGREVLRQRAPEAILDALSNGGMRVEGAKLSGPERRAIAEFLTGRALGFASTGAATGRCTVNPPFSLTSGPTWNGWSPTPTNARFQPATAAGLTADQVPHLVLKWAFGFPDATSRTDRSSGKSTPIAISRP